MKSRDEHIAEIRRLKCAIQKTRSPYLKRDYQKALNRKKKELLVYDRYKTNTTN